MFIQDYISLATAIVAVLGGIIALIQWNKNIKLQRAQFLNAIIDKLRSENDKDLAEALYLIQHNDTWYNKDFYGGSHNEFIIDKLLSFLSYICYLNDKGNISNKEISIVEYILFCVCEKASVQNYLKCLSCRAKERSRNLPRRSEIACTFQYLIDWGIEHKAIDKSIFSDGYKKSCFSLTCFSEIKSED